MKQGTNLDNAKRWFFAKKDTFPKKEFQFKADMIPQKASDGLKIMWNSHSSVYIEIEDKRFFCDPVWSMYLSPIGFGGPKRFFQNPLNRKDIPHLDGVLISHDHYDHLDKSIVKYLSQKGVPFYAPIGVGQILKSWNVPQSQIYMADWYDSILTMAIHSWKEPVERIMKAAEKNKVNLALPKPGQLLSENNFIVNSKWWET